MIEKVVARIPAAQGTYSVHMTDDEHGVKYIYLDPVLYWCILSDSDGMAVTAFQEVGIESMIPAGFEGVQSSSAAFVLPNGSVKVPYEASYSSLGAYAAKHNLVIDQFFCDSDCKDVNVLLGKVNKDDAINIKLDWNSSKT